MLVLGSWVVSNGLSLCCGQADLNYNMQDDPAAFYGVTSQYESSENMTITCSTKVCSFGKQVVEKVEVRMDVTAFSTYRTLTPCGRACVLFLSVIPSELYSLICWFFYSQILLLIE